MNVPEIEEALRDIRRGERQRDRLLSVAKESRGWVVNNLPASEGTVRALLRAACDQEPRESLATARAALRMALELRRPLVLEAVVEVGNALRRCGDLRQAAKALKIAGELRTVTGVDPLATARYFSILASLRNVQRDYDGAIKAATASKRLYEKHGTAPAQVRAVVLEAFIHTDHDRLNEALRLGDQALRGARELGDKRLMAIAHHNICYALVELDLLRPAADMLETWSGLYSATASPHYLIRSRWLLARVQLGEGCAHEAVVTLEKVCESLAAEGAGWEYLIACLHLASAHLELGNSHRTAHICSSLAQLCSAMGAPQPELAINSLAVTARAQEVFRNAISQIRTLRPDRPSSRLDLIPHRPPHLEGEAPRS